MLLVNLFGGFVLLGASVQHVTSEHVNTITAFTTMYHIVMELITMGVARWMATHSARATYLAGGWVVCLPCMQQPESMQR
jgi:hypothetical protein